MITRDIVHAHMIDTRVATNYPLFLKFILKYSEYLSETYSTGLRKIFDRWTHCIRRNIPHLSICIPATSPPTQRPSNRS